MTKKSLLLVLFVLTTVFSVKAQTYSGGSGTEADPYQIATLADLQYLSENSGEWTKHFIQTADIDASVTNTWNIGDHDGDSGTSDVAMGFSPIGNSVTDFTGIYNGNGYLISNLFINRPSALPVGMFGKTGATAMITNLGLIDISIVGKKMVGAVVGTNIGLISECFSTGSVAGEQEITGGLVGYNFTADAVVLNCYSCCSVSVPEYVGGLVGDNFSSATIENSYSVGVVSDNGAGANYIGGLVGINGGSASITNSFWDTETSGQATSAGGTGKTTAEMKTLTTFTNAGWDFEGETTNGTEDIWKMNYCSGYPALSWENIPMILECVTTADNQAITLPLNGATVNVSVDWGDGNTEPFTTAGNQSHTYATANTYTVTISGSLTRFGDDNIAVSDKLTKVVCWGDLGLTSLRYAFLNATNLTQVPSDFPSTVTNVYGIFYGATNFNQDLNSWDVSNVTDMSFMFGSTNFNGNISNWDVSSVTTMKYMFRYAHHFNQDISNWDVSNVEDMSRMFQEVSDFNQDISSWNVSNVTNMNSMFDRATSFNQDLNSWDVSNVTNMSYMFYNETSFDQNISTWDVSQVTDMTDMFNNVTLSTTNYDAILNAWSQLTLQNGVTFSGGNSQYSCVSAEARQSIIDNYTWTITDGGEAADTEDPVLTVQNTTIYLDANGDVTLLATDVVTSATDNCSIADTTLSQTSFDCSDISTPVNVNVTLTDATGNFITEQVTVTVLDTISPSPNESTAPVNAECSVTLTSTEARDNCAGTITGTTSDPLTYDEQGTYNVTWNFDDGNGNISTAVQTVTINDVTNPIPDIATLSDITAECEVTELTAPTATDNCAGTISASHNATLPITGTTVVTWTYEDGNGNSVTQNQNVIIDDVTNPEITCIENQIKQLLEGETVYTVSETEFDPTATDDNCQIASIINDFNNLATLDGETLPIGTTTIIWTVTDDNGNSTDCSFDVTVNAFLGIETLQQNGISIYPNPTNGIVNFDFANNNIQNIIISDITGKQIIEKTNIQQNEMINLSNFENGIYIIKIQTDNELFTTKIVKE